MFSKLLLILSLTFLLANCKSFNLEKDKDMVEDFIIEDQPQNEQEFETVNDEEAEALNKTAEDKIEEIEVPDRIFFALDSSTINDQAKSILDIQIEWLKSDDSINITIEGHCDERGTREYNIALGERRANATKKYLAANGIDPKRINTISYGKEKPAFIGSGKSIWSKNRRSVTIVKE